MDEQKALLQGLWRKAWGQETPLEIPCGSESNATRLRFALYNSVRDVRKGKGQADDALKQATENCGIGFLPGDRTVVVMQKKVMTDLMQTIAGIVGEAPGVLKSEEDMAVEASQSLLLEKVANPEAGLSTAELGLHRKTPYYER